MSLAILRKKNSDRLMPNSAVCRFQELLEASVYKSVKLKNYYYYCILIFYITPNLIKIQ